MKSLRNQLRWLGLILSFLAVTPITQAAIEKRTAVLQGSNIADGAAPELEVEDQWYDYILANPDDGSDPSPFTDAFQVKNSHVNLKLTFDDALLANYTQAWSIEVQYDLTLYAVDGTSQVLSGQSLVVDYDPSANYTDIALKRYDDGLRAEIDITQVILNNISPIPDDVRLEATTVVERYYSLSHIPPTVSVTLLDVTGHDITTPLDDIYNNELELTWTYVEGAESYDLEWVFIDAGNSTNYAAFEVDFSNATRIQTPFQHYKIPLAYPRGWIAYRVRGTGWGGTNCDEFTASNWSYAPHGGVEDLDQVITDGVAVGCYGLERNLNWQHQAAYAEDGKRKDVLSIHDGALYGRQSVTVLNTDDNAIIGESYYDYQGRASVSAMPAPIDHQGLKYYPGFNVAEYVDPDPQLNPTGIFYSYDRWNFGFDSHISGGPDAMSTDQSTGSGHYFSTHNTTQEGINGAYTPDAAGFPFSQVRFKNDGTGRVAAQSGVGPDFKFSSGKEVRYYYGTPSIQEELDRLFGNEVGYVHHYQKNMVVDPNGQVSVAYIDQEGRVIATALAGDAPANVLALDNTSEGQQMTGSLLGNNELNQNFEWVSMIALSVSSDGLYSFEYDLTGEVYCDDCLNDDGIIEIALPDGEECKECRYDLEIRILDEVGELVYLNVVNDFSFEDADQGSFDLDFTANLTVGTYSVQKTLSLSQTTIDGYQSAFQAFQEANKLDTIGCVPYNVETPEPCDCNSLCDLAFTDPDSVALCKALNCGTPSSVPNECEIKRQVMIYDLSPGGQYYDNAPSQFLADMSVDPNYDHNEWLSNQSGMLTKLSNDIGITFADWDDFKAQWQDDWAETYMLSFHPEYCAYDYFCNFADHCQPTGGAPAGTAGEFHEFVEFLYAENTNSYATTEGLFNPTDVQGMSSSSSPNGPTGDQQLYLGSHSSVTANQDPLFECTRDYTTDVNVDWSLIDEEIEGYLKQYLENPHAANTYYSIWYVIDNPDDIGGAGYPDATIDDDVEDFFKSLHDEIAAGTFTEFEYFRSAYMFFREKIIYDDFYTYNPTNGPCTGSNVLLENGDAVSGVTGGTYDQNANAFQIIFPVNPIYETWPDLDDLEDYASSSLDDYCDENCIGYQSVWEEQLEGCTFTAEEEWEIIQYFTEICKANCNGTYPNGSSGCPTCPGVTDADLPTTGFGSNGYLHAGPYYTFDEVIVAYNSGCSTSIVHPTPIPTIAECNCGQFYELLDQFGYDVNTSGADIAALLNGIYAPAVPITSSEATNWRDDCDADTENADFTNFPTGLICDELEQEVDPVAAFMVDCDEDALLQAQLNAELIFQQLLEDKTAEYLANYRAKCMDIEDREAFTVTYTLKEYHYTLYYYDQAGNRIKTVPPAGVDILTDGDLTDCALHRQYPHDPINAPNGFIHPDHQYVTQYKYNSLQQLISQNTPDGAESTFWYDYLGRVIFSQNAKQAAMSTPRYSYMLYDDLGRNYEAGEIEENSVEGPMTYEISRDELLYSDWISGAGAGARFEVVRSHYDEAELDAAVEAAFADGVQHNLRNRVASVTYSYNEESTPDPLTYDYACHYTYDIHGNVTSALKEIVELADIGQGFKRIDYDYDLISGNVNEVRYQTEQWDQFHHRYEYDADNRLTIAESSRDGLIWEKEEKYFYYAHGSLARKELGDKQVQAMDYVSNLQGWLKSVNSASLQYDRDPGEDGNYTGVVQQDPFGGKINQVFAQDIFGFSLGYYDGDYAGVAGIDDFEINASNNTELDKTTSNLYNGNIGHMVTGIGVSTLADNVQAMAYEYDQLHRLKHAKRVINPNISANHWDVLTTDAAYEVNLDYDANGNILQLKRNGTPVGNSSMDDLNYWYYDDQGGVFDPDVAMPTSANPTNQLAYVDDGVLSYYNVDIDDQNANNYQYDEIGQLISDDAEHIDKITWDVRNKVRRIDRDGSNPGNASNLEFLYGPMGDRWVKIEKPKTGGTVHDQTDWVYTYYVRDASGNVMATYTRNFEPDPSQAPDGYKDHLAVSEHHIYGASRVGVFHNTEAMSATFEASLAYNATEGCSTFVHPINHNPTVPNPGAVAGVWTKERELGKKSYECANHLGNVLVVVSDIKRPDIVDSYGMVNLYAADVQSYSDYYPFGMLMPGRSGNSGDYRYGFNGMEQDKEVSGDGNSYTTAFRSYNSRLGRWTSLDPLMASFASTSPYEAFAGNPCFYTDPHGLAPHNGGEEIVINMEKDDGMPVLPASADEDQRVTYNYSNGAVLMSETFVYQDNTWVSVATRKDGTTFESSMPGKLGYSFSEFKKDVNDLKSGAKNAISLYNELGPRVKGAHKVPAKTGGPLAEGRWLYQRSNGATTSITRYNSDPELRKFQNFHRIQRTVTMPALKVINVVDKVQLGYDVVDFARAPSLEKAKNIGLEIIDGIADRMLFSGNPGLMMIGGTFKILNYFGAFSGGSSSGTTSGTQMYNPTPHADPNDPTIWGDPDTNAPEKRTPWIYNDNPFTDPTHWAYPTKF